MTELERLTTEDTLTLAERVIRARETLGLTQSEAADLVGVSLAELQQLEVLALVSTARGAQ